LLLDTQYTDQEYQQHMGWGHGSLTSAVRLALDAQAGTLILFHHDPGHSDATIDKMVEDARKFVASNGGNLEVEAAREGAEISLNRTA
jgi:ribonuclease BN (tRNA processing enzyme)